MAVQEVYHNHHHFHWKICLDYWVEVMVNEGWLEFGEVQVNEGSWEFGEV